MRTDWALERRHPQVFRLERERQPNPLVAEERTEFRIEAPPRLEQRHQFDQLGAGQIEPTLEGLLEKRGEPLELAAVALHEPRKRPRIGRREPGDLGLHPRDVGSGEEFTTGTEDQPILRIEADHVHLLPQIAATGGKDFLEDPRVKKERGAEIEPETLGRGDRAGATTGHRKTLEHPDPDA